jgi:hypothetical protein
MRARLKIVAKLSKWGLLDQSHRVEPRGKETLALLYLCLQSHPSVAETIRLSRVHASVKALSVV